MQTSTLECKWDTRQRSPVLYVLFAVPIMTLVMAAQFVMRGQGKGALFLLPVAAFAVGLAFWVSRAQRRAKSCSLTIDPARERITFRNFVFVSRFLPEKPRAQEEISFSEVLGSRVDHGRGGIQFLTLRTTRGKVTIPSRIEHFEAIEGIVDDIVASNESNAELYARQLAAEPKVQTPWYGWLLLVLPIAGILWVCWKVFNSE
jgi:hypothetical protein